jgi:hypothetical protein
VKIIEMGPKKMKKVEKANMYGKKDLFGKVKANKRKKR